MTKEERAAVPKQPMWDCGMKVCWCVCKTMFRTANSSSFALDDQMSIKRIAEKPQMNSSTLVLDFMTRYGTRKTLE